MGRGAGGGREKEWLRGVGVGKEKETDIVKDNERQTLREMMGRGGGGGFFIL